MRIRKTSGVYGIRNRANAKIYVGSSVNIGDRWTDHIGELNSNSHDNPHLQAAWIKYGAEAFEFIVLEEVKPERSALVEAEQKWIDYYSASDKSKGYNLMTRAYSRLGAKHSDETRQKMRESQKGNGGYTFNRAKVWPGFVSPSGIEYRNVYSLRAFAAEHGLTESLLFRVATGDRPHHKGWRAIPLDS